MIVSVPSSAFGRDPVTGASRNISPRSPSRSPIDRLALGAIVDMSTASPPSGRPSAAPSSPSSTASTSGTSGTIEIAMPAAAAPAAVSATVTLSCSPASSSARSRVRFHATTSIPARARLAAIGRPMIPRPRKPIRSSRE